MNASGRRVGFGVVAVVLTLVGALLSAPVARADSAPLDPAAPATPTTVAADALPTTQIDGVAWSQVVVGNTVYVAGNFAYARPAGAAVGANETPRGNLLAYDIRNGNLVTSFAPDLNAQALVVTASPDGSRIYVGGDFTVADGQPRSRIAAYSTATGTLVPEFKPVFSAQVGAIAVTGSAVYVGGGFSSVGGVARGRLAALSPSGALLPWAPQTGAGTDKEGEPAVSSTVNALVATNDGTQIVAGGRFGFLNGDPATGVGALDATTGATRPFAVNQLITNRGDNSAINHLSTDGTTVWMTAYDFGGPGNLEGVVSAVADGGALIWEADCRGDSYASYATGGTVYVASHAHVCSNIGGFPEETPRVNRRATALSAAATGTVGPNTIINGNFAGKPAPTVVHWYPTFYAGTFTGQTQAAWTVTGNSEYVVFGGEFPAVNTSYQQGLVRFAVPAKAPNKVGPRFDRAMEPTVAAVTGGALRVSWPTAADRDNQNLTYRVVRDGDTRDPVYDSVQDSVFYAPRTLSVVDRGLAPGTSHTYQVLVSDPFGNITRSPVVSGTVSDAAVSDYGRRIVNDGAEHYWSMGTPGTTVFDTIGTADLTIGTGLTPDPDSALTVGGNGSLRGDGTSRARGSAGPTPAPAPASFTLETWVRTTSTTGGRIAGFGNAKNGANTANDRILYLDAGGRLSFGIKPGRVSVQTSPRAVNDGRWHHVAATLGPAGQELYVDGTLVGREASITTGSAFRGYWQLGGPLSAEWPGRRSTQDLAGSVDEVAVYPAQLTAEQIADHVAAAAGTAPPINVAPTASFTSDVKDLDVALDGSASADPDGTIASYAWDFGDGARGDGPTPAHTYPEAGTYPVTLTVTDDRGATATAIGKVDVTAPNVPPTASFTATTTGLAVTVDASASADPDGTVTAFGWDFGDGATATGPRAEHTYAAAGTYPVILTVTDDRGGQATVTESVAVTAPDALPGAADTFEREIGTGWGNADAGGAWTVMGPARIAAVTGGQGQLTVAPGRSGGARLDGVSVQDVAIRTDITLPAAPTGGGTYVYVGARRVGDDGYRTKIRYRSDGVVEVNLIRVEGNAETTLAGYRLPGTVAAGTPLTVSLDVAGAGRTTIAAKVWPTGSAEPATWNLQAVDDTAALQRPGAPLLQQYVSGSAVAPSVVRFDNYSVGPAGAVPAPR